MIWISNTRVLAAFAVILIHISATTLSKSHLGDANWWAANFFDSFSRWCVPIFIMISGHLLLGQNSNTIEFIKKRFSKILIPLLFWSIFYLFWSTLKGLIKPPAMTLNDALASVVNGTPYYHMWFLYMLGGLYISTPIINFAFKKLSPPTALAISIVGLFLSSAYVIFSFQPDERPSILTNIALYLPYFLFGGALKSTKITAHRTPLFVLIFFISGMTTAIGYFWFSGSYGDYFYRYMSITTLASSVAIFLLAASSKSLSTSRLIPKYAHLTFGVYLIHPIFLDIISYSTPAAYTTFSIITIPIIALAVYGVCSATCRLISSIPLLSKVI